MNKIIPTLTIIALLFTATACKKGYTEPEIRDPEPDFKQPVMHYVDLTGIKVSTPNTAYHIDMDNDGTREVSIQALPVGATDRYELQFNAGTGLYTFLFTDSDGIIEPLTVNDKITPNATATRDWYNLASAMLMNKITPTGANAYWQGNWRDLGHKYFGFMQKRSGNNYLGWIELSTNTATGFVELHRAAISTEPNKPIKAGL